MLNKEQQQAKKKILNFINRGSGVFGLIGSGGTGKTYLITSLPDVEEYQFLAPTNKAVNILRKGLEKNGIIQPKVKTVDSFFKFKVEKDEYNKSVYSYKQPDAEKIAKVIVVDEVSMLSDKHVDLLLNMNKKVPLIFIGDNMQIPPVENEENKFYNEKGFQVSKSFLVMDEVCELTIQNRQKEESKLFQLISGFRKNMDKRIELKQIPIHKQNGVDIIFLHQDSNEFYQFVKENNCIAVSFKNNTADLFNYKIGKSKTSSERYNIKDVNIGDVLMFNSVYKRDSTMFYTSETVEVLNKGEEKVSIEIPYIDEPIQFYQTMAVVKSENGKQDLIWLKNNQLRDIVYRKVYNKRKQFINQMVDGNFDVAKKLKKINTFYSDFVLGFANLKKPYAITSHKSQGSTYENVIIPIYDFYKKEYQDSNQLLYVAMSRASEKVIFVDGWCNFNGSTRRVMFTQEEKYLILSLQDWMCNICGVELFDGGYEIDHKLRLGCINEKGDIGNNTISNLQGLCKECHKEKTNEQRKQSTTNRA